MERRFLLLTCAVAMATSMSGCDQREGDPCGQVARPCESEGDRRCSDDVATIEVCGEVKEGCLGWTEEMTCPGGERCDDGGAEVLCRCPDEDVCAEEGETTCRGSVLGSCSLEDGCLRFGAERDCADDGLPCRSGPSGAACAQECSDECPPGERRCEADAIEVCDVSDVGCLEWAVELDCAARDEVCDDSQDVPFCHPECGAPCEVPGSTRCSAAVVQSCAEVAGCLSWVNQQDCSIDRMDCDDSEEPAHCVCADICVEGERRCHHTDVDWCALRSDGCWVWEPIFDCYEMPWVCDDAGGELGCVGGTGESCDDALAAFSLPFVLSGTDFRADFGDALRLLDPSCTSVEGAEESVVGVLLSTGQTLVVDAGGGLYVLSVHEEGCGGGHPCAESGAAGETVRYTAAADGVVWVVVAIDPAAVSPAAYEVRFELSEE